MPLCDFVLEVAIECVKSILLLSGSKEVSVFAHAISLSKKILTFSPNLTEKSANLSKQNSQIKSLGPSDARITASNILFCVNFERLSNTSREI